MGCLWRLVFHEADEARARTARDAAWARLAALDACLSDWKEDSALNKLGREGRLEAPPDDLRRVLAEARAMAELTLGAFNPAVGPLVRLWRQARRSRQLPPAAAIAKARQEADWRQLTPVPASGAITLARGGMLLDLGGIAKGFAQDEVLAVLAQHGVRSAIVDAAGGVSARGTSPGGKPWRAAIAGADGLSLPLRDTSLATSGDLHQAIQIGGRKFSHIVDPATGLGLENGIQASVAAASGARADALATAACVLGWDRAPAFAWPPGTAVRVQAPSGESWENEAFRQLRGA